MGEIGGEESLNLFFQNCNTVSCKNASGYDVNDMSLWHPISDFRFESISLETIERDALISRQ